MQLYLLSFPLWLLFVVLVPGSAVVVGGACWLAGRRLRGERQANLEGLAIFQTVGAIFGITLAFTISTVYGEFQSAASNVSQESNAIRTVERLTKQLPEPQRSDVRDALHSYVERAVDEEWPKMMQGQESFEVALALERLWLVQQRFPLGGHVHHALEERLYQHLHDLTDRRRDRLLASRSRLAPLMWTLLLGGGLITVGFAAYLRSGNDRSHAVMTGALAAVVASGLLLVMVLDCPFSGSVHVPAAPLADTLVLLQPAAT